MNSVYRYEMGKSCEERNTLTPGPEEGMASDVLGIGPRAGSGNNVLRIRVAVSCFAIAKRCSAMSS